MMLSQQMYLSWASNSVDIKTHGHAQSYGHIY